MNHNQYLFLYFSGFLFLFFLQLPGLEFKEDKTVGIDSDLPIDRYALVTRHNPLLEEADKLSPLSVGNGEFAFTADITGLQTFPDFYSREEDDSTPPGPDGFISTAELEGATPLATQSQWGLHTFPNPGGFSLADATSIYNAHGRDVPYASGQYSDAGAWLRANPHRLNLARIGFVLKKNDDTTVELDDLTNIRQELDLWSGTLTSQFDVEEHTISVRTWVHPELDQLSVQIDAPTMNSEQLSIKIAFPYGRGQHAGDPSDWSKPDKHSTVDITSSPGQHSWHRILDKDEYFVQLSWEGRGDVQKKDQHKYVLSFADTDSPISFSVYFSEDKLPGDHELPNVEATESASSDYWQGFWSSGGAIDLSESRDTRAHELERRIVLSQYLMAIQSSGTFPPQETGLTYNSWFGKFHLEMHWWHGVHFALWDRLSLLENSLGWYESIMPNARETARLQGYEGVRWPKMVGPDGRESPSTIGVFLIWQQPHPIYYAELVYREKQDNATLEEYREIVFETAEFMASYPDWLEEKGEYVLGPPMIPAQESHAPEVTYNPAFELAYWKYGLETAQIWRERLGMGRDPDWDEVLQNLSPLPQKDGLYVNTASAPETFLDPDERRDHPTLLAPCGFLPCTHANKEMMRKTLLEVMQSWNWDHTWGWDYPLIAMTAARVGEPEIAIEALLMDVQKNTYLPNGHNYQDTRLTIYLPGNGGLLTAVAMMAAGWENGPSADAPGFPDDDRWVVRWEGLKPML